MNVTLCLRLPFLRGPLPRGLDPDSSSAPAWPGALRLWPGLPDDLCAVHDAAAPACGRHRPSNYPFSEREAAACLADLRQMDVAALSGLPAGETAMQAALWRNAATLVQHVWAGAHAGRNNS